MTVNELNRDQLVELKERYMLRLADEGNFNAVIYNAPELDEREDTAAPSWGELASADRLVPDEVIMNEEAGAYFTDDDFFCTAN